MTSAPSSFCSLVSSASEEARPLNTISSTSSCRPLTDADGVLQPVQIAVNDMHVHLEPRAQHADGIGHAVLAVHEKMLADGVEDAVLGRQVDGLGVLDHVLHVVLGDLAVGGHHRMHAAVVEAADVAAGDAEINAADLHVGHLLGLDDGVADVLLGGAGVARSRPCARRASAPGRGR